MSESGNARRAGQGPPRRSGEARSRNAVGVYERPHPLRTRKVLVPVAIFAIVALAYALYFFLR